MTAWPGKSPPAPVELYLLDVEDEALSRAAGTDLALQEIPGTRAIGRELPPVVLRALRRARRVLAGRDR